MSTKMQTLPNSITRPQTVAKGGKIAAFYNQGLSWEDAAKAAGIRVNGSTAKYYAEAWAADTGGYLRQTTVHKRSRDRAIEAYELRKSGMLVKEIAAYYGIAPAGASQLVKKGERLSNGRTRTTTTETTNTTDANLSRDSDIRELGFTARAEKVLLRNSVYTIDQLMLVTEDILVTFGGCGKTTTSEIVNMRDRMIGMFII